MEPFDTTSFPKKFSSDNCRPEIIPTSIPLANEDTNKPESNKESQTIDGVEGTQLGESELTRMSCIWDEVGALICRAINEDNYERWFENVSLARLGDGVATLEVPNPIYPLWIEMNYQREVITAFAAVTGETLRLEFETQEAGSYQQTSSDEAGGALRANDSHDSGSPDEGELDKGDELSQPRPRPPAAVAPKLTDKAIEKAGVLSKFSFDTFVVGESNRYAYAAAKAVADAPGRAYNPLFLHGKAGLGKTHLLHSIGLGALRRNPKARILYRTSEDWVNEFIEAIERRSLSAFRSRYRNIDVLLLDDVQFLGGKEQSKSEFFHTFNTLFDGHKQIVLSSDRPASEIRQIEPRLRSRFDCGLTAELVLPNRETRLAILKSKAQRFSARLEPEVLEFLAERVTSDIRTLEGALVRVASYVQITQSRPSITELEHYLRDVINSRSGRLTIDDIQRAVVEQFDLRLADMTSKDRRAPIAYPRQIAMLLARQLTDSTLKDIGEAFGGRDHGTVLHAVRKLTGFESRDRDQLEREVAEIRRRLEGA